MDRLDSRRNRERILDAAVPVLIADRTAPLERIFEASGLGRTTCFRHFPNRPALSAALAERALRTIREVLVAARPDEPPFEDALRRMTQAALRVGVAAWDVLRLVSEDELAMSPEVPGITAVLTQLIDLGQADGSLRRDLPGDWLVECYLALLEAAVREQRHDDEAADRVIGMLLDGARQR